MLALNQALFLWLNAPAEAPKPIVDFALAVAIWLVAIVPALLVALWIWGSVRNRPGLIVTALAAATALGINQLLGLLWYEPRPFMVHVGRTLMAHAPDNSFPSDHATLMLTVAFGLMTTRAAPRWGTAVLFVGLAVAWSRLYLGVHFPIDMAASAVIAIACAFVAALLVGPAERWPTPILCSVYDSILDIVRAPPRLFRRCRHES
jgi:undecaprenyl-diphosphatase